MKVGVLALQGDFREHILATTQCGHEAIEVRRLAELESVDALILPGENPPPLFIWPRLSSYLIPSASALLMDFQCMDRVPE